MSAAVAFPFFFWRVAQVTHSTGAPSAGRQRSVRSRRGGTCDRARPSAQRTCRMGPPLGLVRDLRGAWPWSQHANPCGPPEDAGRRRAWWPGTALAATPSAQRVAAVTRPVDGPLAERAHGDLPGSRGGAGGDDAEAGVLPPAEPASWVDPWLGRPRARYVELRGADGDILATSADDRANRPMDDPRDVPQPITPGGAADADLAWRVVRRPLDRHRVTEEDGTGWWAASGQAR